MAFQQYNIYPGLTPVRLVSTSNISGTYFNGALNNGVGATLTIAASSLTIDSVVCVVGDRVLLQTQTNTNETGIYVVLSIGSTVVLQRAADMQSIEQIRAGQFVSVGAGSVEAGNIFSIVEPLPAHFGIDALVVNADPSAAGVAFSGGASTANAIPVFSNTSGDIKAATTTATLGQSLSVTGTVTGSTGVVATTGDVVATAGKIQGLNLVYGATPVPQVDPASCTIAGVAGAANHCTITIQLKDGSGTNMARVVPFKVYLATDSTGLTLQSAASTGYSVSSGGVKDPTGSTTITQGIAAFSSATGGCVIDLLDTGKGTGNLILMLPNGFKASAAITAGSYG